MPKYDIYKDEIGKDTKNVTIYEAIRELKERKRRTQQNIDRQNGIKEILYENKKKIKVRMVSTPKIISLGFSGGKFCQLHLML